MRKPLMKLLHLKPKYREMTVGMTGGTLGKFCYDVFHGVW